MKKTMQISHTRETSTMNTCRFGTTAVSECLYSVSFERTMHKFGMTAVTNGTSVQRPPDYLE